LLRWRLLRKVTVQAHWRGRIARRGTQAIKEVALSRALFERFATIDRHGYPMLCFKAAIQLLEVAWGATRGGYAGANWLWRHADVPRSASLTFGDFLDAVDHFQVELK
jgi:hypothetical protein